MSRIVERPFTTDIIICSIQSTHCIIQVIKIYSKSSTEWWTFKKKKNWNLISKKSHSFTQNVVLHMNERVTYLRSYKYTKIKWKTQYYFEKHFIHENRTRSCWGFRLALTLKFNIIIIFCAFDTCAFVLCIPYIIRIFACI